MVQKRIVGLSGSPLITIHHSLSFLPLTTIHHSLPSYLSQPFITPFLPFNAPVLRSLLILQYTPYDMHLQSNEQENISLSTDARYELETRWKRTRTRLQIARQGV